MRILIAGAGIGGLAAALALKRAGCDEAQVLERAPELGEVGAGLQLSPNAMKAMRALGVDEAAAEVAVRPDALEMRDGKNGSLIFSIPMGDAAIRRYGAPYLHIHRADLLDVLAKAAAQAGARVRTGACVAGYAMHGNHVRAGLDTGQVVEGELLIGADGLNSAVRSQLTGPDLPRFAGCSAWRLTVPAAAVEGRLPHGAAVVWTGPGRHAVTYRIRRGELVNFVGVVETRKRGREGWDESGDLEELRHDFRGFADPVQAVIGAAESCMRRALYDRDPLPSWSGERVTLLGDACHAMPPFQAQGAAMALEDAVVLAELLRRKAPLAETLARYEALRKPRAAKVLESARANMGIFHRSNPVTQLATYGPMRIASRLMPGFVASRQDWIYAYDPVGAAS